MSSSTTQSPLSAAQQAVLAQKYLRLREKQNAYRRKHYANNKENICKKSQEHYAKNVTKNLSRDIQLVTKTFRTGAF